MAKKQNTDPQPEDQVGDQEQVKERSLTQAQVEEYSAGVWKSRVKAINQEQIKCAARLYPAVAELVEENERLKAALSKAS